MPKWLQIFFITFLLFFLGRGLVLGQTELTVTINVGDTVLTLSGKTSSNSIVTVVEGGAVIGTTIADSNGDFEKSFFALTPGLHTIGIYSADSNGLTTSTVNYPISLTAFQETTLSNIVLPPTISWSATTVNQGEIIEFSAMSVPLSTITLFITSNTITKTTTADGNGVWSFSFDTGELEAGDHSVYAKATTSSGYTSESSKVGSFKVEPVATTAPGPTTTSAPTTAATVVPTAFLAPTVADLTLVSPSPGFLAPSPQPAIPSVVAFFDVDGSGRIEVGEIYEVVKQWVDVWRGKRGEGEECDLNSDRECNLVDLSILLFYIGK